MIYKTYLHTTVHLDSTTLKVTMARAQVSTVCLMMLLALAALATTASAADHMMASSGGNRKLHSATQVAAIAEASFGTGRKLAAADATQQRPQRCDWIYGHQYCPGGTQFNCCRGEDRDNRMWTGCRVHDNNYVCPSTHPKAVCCWA